MGKGNQIKRRQPARGEVIIVHGGSVEMTPDDQWRIEITFSPSESEDRAQYHKSVTALMDKLQNREISTAIKNPTDWDLLTIAIYLGVGRMVIKELAGCIKVWLMERNGRTVSIKTPRRTIETKGMPPRMPLEILKRLELPEGRQITSVRGRSSGQLDRKKEAPVLAAGKKQKGAAKKRTTQK